VQSRHANPVYLYYQEPDADQRQFMPVTVTASVAQAAMIGNPVSMPRVIRLVEEYNRRAGKQRVFFVEVQEQEIMDSMLRANRNGHIACTHGGESLAGLIRAKTSGMIGDEETAVLASTAHALKFSGFQEMYFENRFPDEFQVEPNPELINHPLLIQPKDLEKVPAPGAPLKGKEFQKFIDMTSCEIAERLSLENRNR
jgi:threonine synthase